MFIYSVKASTLRFAAIVAVGVAVFAALLVFVPPYEEEPIGLEAAAVSYENVKTDEQRREFLLSLGLKVTDGECEQARVRIPREFDKIYAGYNEMQKVLGLDLSKYKNKEVERYTYTLSEYEDYEGTVYANLLVYRGNVIGGDVCSADPGGFVVGLMGK